MFDSSPNCSISFSKLGKDNQGECRERSMSSANAATLKSLFALMRTLISGLALSLFKRGSNDRTKNRGDRGDDGHPCRLLLLMAKAFDRWPFTHTLAEGVEYNALISAYVRGRSPIPFSTSCM